MTFGNTDVARTAPPLVAICSVLTEQLESGVWASDRGRLWLCEKERCLSSTTGQMAVGGRMCTRWSPRVHSGLTCEAHLLCS